jgi:8-oxo-dGTP diphosphatase
VKKIELAGCVILDDYGRILLMHRSTEDLSQWELPGGKVDSDETAEAAAVREIKEELGVDVRLTKSLGNGEFQTEEKEYRYTWFQAVITAGEADLQEPETFDDLEYFEIEDLLSLALSQNMQVLLEKLFSGEVSFIV